MFTRLGGIDRLALVGFPAKQTIEIVAGDGPIGAAVLEQEARQRSLHQSVLIPLGMGAHEFPHGVIEIFGELIDDTDEGGGVLWGLLGWGWFWQGAHAALLWMTP
jgi:hypothetical protein